MFGLMFINPFPLINFRLTPFYPLLLFPVQGESEINGHHVEIKKVTPKEGGPGGWGAPGFGGPAAGGWGGYGDPYGYGGYGGTGFLSRSHGNLFSDQVFNHGKYRKYEKRLKVYVCIYKK
jgi:hypothetical protein